MEDKFKHPKYVSEIVKVEKDYCSKFFDSCCRPFYIFKMFIQILVRIYLNSLKDIDIDCLHDKIKLCNVAIYFSILAMTCVVF